MNTETLQRSNAPTLRRIFEWVLPRKWRTRPEPQPEINDHVLARLTDTDPVYRALMDQALEQLQNAMLSAMERNLDSEQRAFQCGQAAALAQHIMGIENWAARARADQARMTKQQPNQQNK